MMLRCTARGLGQIRLLHAEGEVVRGGAGRWRRAAEAAATLLAWSAMATGVAMARDPEPSAHIPLEPMGYQSMMPEFMLAGSSMLTVHFVDTDHLLVTFNVRRLMKREVDPPPDDDDRTIAAVLVELPSGKVMAKTEWRAHDRSQYLWSLGDGRFMLRVRDRLTMIAPLQMLASGDAFQEAPLLQFDRHIVAVLVSSDEDLLTVETTRPPGSVELRAGSSADPAPVQVNFYRLIRSGGPTGRLTVTMAGAIRTRTAVAIPMTTTGLVEVLEGGKDRWLFNFNEHAGKVLELAEWDTTCFPHPIFVGRTEFVAFGCRGSSDRQELAGFNLKGEEMWQQNFSDTHVSPTFVFAPTAGRFALGRTILSGAFDTDAPLPASMVTTQEVRVYQSYDGKQLFRAECSPVERAGQNFALSEDGMRLAVVRETLVRHSATKDSDSYTQRDAAVEVYTLPPLTNADRAALKESEALAPEDTGARIDLALERLATPAASEKRKDDSQAAASATAPASPTTAAPTLDASQVGGQRSPAGTETPAATATPTESGTGAATAASGDQPESTAPRKPPTLYGPDEKTKAKPPQ